MNSGCQCGGSPKSQLDKMPELAEVFSRFKTGQREYLIPILQETQKVYGYLSRQAMLEIAHFVNLPASKVYGVATFYNQFRLTPLGENVIMICTGTACHVRGSDQVLRAFEAELGIKAGHNTKDNRFTLETVACLGSCSIAPVVTINGTFHGKLTPKDVPALVKAINDQADQKSSAGKKVQHGVDFATLFPRRDSILTQPPAYDELASGKLAERLAVELLDRNPTKPVIYVGLGTCGLASGGMKIWDQLTALIAEGKLDATLKKTGCIGYCEREVMVDIKKPGKPRVSFANVTPEKMTQIVESYLQRDELPTELVLGISESYPEGPSFEVPKEWAKVSLFKQLPYFEKQQRIVLKNCGTFDPDSIDEYIAKGGYQALAKAIKTMTPRQVVDEVLKSGLRGRGGGGFPTGKKWEFAFDQKADQKYIVMNADEGDPGAFMDRSVLEGDPHKVIEGIAIGGYAIGATRGYIYVRAEYPLAVERLNLAIREAERLNLLGTNILGSGVDFHLKLKMGAGAFVCGEETALLASIEGKRGMPRPRPPFPAVSGAFGKPTVINNVETYANVPEIIVRGGKWFASIGTEKSKGTKVFALTGKVNCSGLIEVPMGITLREIIFNLGNGIQNGKAFKSAQIGGPSGGCLPKQCLDTPIDYDSLIAAGAMMGSGGLVVMDETTCMVDIARYFLNFTRSESCGKCIPCREGIARLQEMLDKIVKAPEEESGNMTLERFKAIIDLKKTCELIRDTAACGLGNTAPNPILSTLNYFRDEYDAHIFERRCPSGKCKSLLKFKINVPACKGCGLCKKKCPNAAIVGDIKHPHYIIAEKCVRCGVCQEVCPFKAVEVE